MISADDMNPILWIRSGMIQKKKVNKIWDKPKFDIFLKNPRYGLYLRGEKPTLYYAFGFIIQIMFVFYLKFINTLICRPAKFVERKKNCMNNTN